MNKLPPARYALDPKTGALAAHTGAFDPKKANRFEYNERFLESLLVLNPMLLRVERHVPLVVHGGQSSADQVYVDDIGRLVAVECKSGKATRGDLVQLLGYGFQLPFDAIATEADAELLGADVAMVRPGDEVLRKLSENVFSVDKDESIASRKAALDKALGKSGAVDELTAHATKRLGLTAYVPCADERRFVTSVRMVLVASGFTDDCVELCKELNARTIDVSLVKVDVFDLDKKRFVVREVIHAPVGLHAVRDAIGHVWRDAETRARYVPEGWYFSTEKPCFAFVGRNGSNAAFWLELDGTEPLVGTRVPHSTFEKKEAARLEARLKACLPRGFEKKTRRDWEWRGTWTAEEWADSAVKTGRAVFEAFGGR